MAFTDRKTCVLLFCVVLFVAIVRASDDAINTTLEEYVKQKVEESYQENLKEVIQNPDELTDEFTVEVDEELIGKNDTRRHLKTSDKCKATNPIDRCWRCDPNWANNRKKLADCAKGFGSRTTGGKKGKIYVVTDPSDDEMDHPKPGTLRHAVIQSEPLWIIFQSHMVIKLKNELIMTSDKTIDGRGVQVRIAYGAGLTLQFIHNVIIHNIWIHNISEASGGMIRDALSHIGLRTKSDGDAISVFSSSNIWIDHCSLSQAQDGLIDVIEGSTAVTISNCKFNHHNDVMLLGATDKNDKDKIMQVTVAFNRFGQGCIQRLPRCRWGYFHVVNNDYSHWELYAIGGSSHPTIISQGNRFRPTNNKYTKEVTKRDYASKEEWMKWQWRSEGDLFMNGAYFTESGPPLKHTKNPFTDENKINFKPGSFAGRLARYAGALKCREGKLC